MPNRNYFLDAHSQYFTEYLLSGVLKRANYTLSSIEMIKESYFVEGETRDFLVAKVVAIDNRDGMISYPKIYPRYFTDDDFNNSFLGKREDLIVRFSVFFNKTGFFSPLWTGIVEDGNRQMIDGERMDWDKYRRIAPKMTYAQYTMEKAQAKNSTFMQNDEVILRTIPIWLSNAAILTEG